MLLYCDLWPKEFKIEYVVDRSTTRNFTVPISKFILFNISIGGRHLVVFNVHFCLTITK